MLNEHQQKEAVKMCNDLLIEVAQLREELRQVLAKLEAMTKVVKKR